MAKNKKDGKNDEKAEIEASADAAPANDTIEAVSSPEGEAPAQQQFNLQIDDRGADIEYASTARVWGSAEEINIDFSQGIKPTGQANQVRLKIDRRMVLNPWAAKRLAMTLGQTIARYEQTYGALELDENKRRKGAPSA